MVLTEALTQRIEAIAKREGRTPQEVLQSLLDAYEQQDPLEDFIGAFDDDVTDLSVTVRDTLKRKFAHTDDNAT